MSEDRPEASVPEPEDHALLGWVTRRRGRGRSEERRVGKECRSPDRRIETRLARRLVSGAGLSFAGQLLLAGMVAFLTRDVLPPVHLGAWISVVVAGVLVRYRLPSRVDPEDEPDDARRLMRWAVAISAATWSGGAVIFAPALTFAHLALLMVVLSGMVAAAVNTMSADRTTFHAFAGVLLGGLLVALVRHGLARGVTDLHLAAVLLVVLFGVIVVLLVRDTFRTLRRGVETAVELEEHEAQAERESSFLTALVQSVPDAIVAMHRDGRILGVNRGFEEIFGWEPHEALGRDLNALVVPEGEREAARDLDRELIDGGALAYEVHRIRKDGRPVDLRASAAPVRGVPDVMVVLYHDITRLKETERALERAKEDAEAANRAKSEFLATMSHEIRTPMNAIIGMAELLEETDLSPTQRDYVQVFRTAGDTLLDLINEVLDLSKIEAGHLELEEESFELWELVDETVQVFAVPAHSKGVELTAHVDPGVPRWVEGDPGRLRQVLVNLLGNAVKFTEEGEVVLEVRPVEDGGDGGEGGEAEGHRVRFAVRDTGPGIPEDRLNAIFERFTQADSSTTRKHGGTGLGLTISAALVKRMDGEIGVESELGEGSRFHFTARFGDGEPRRREPAEAPPGKVEGLDVLVVDDNATNRLVVREMLSGWGARPAAVASGEEALRELRRRRDEGDPYDMVLLDGQMPGMDGFHVAEVIRDDPELVNVSMMMLTSTGDRPELVDRARRAGIGEYLVKPVRRSRLLEAMRKTLDDGEGVGQEDGEPGPEGEPTARGARVLLVEDTEENRMLIGAYLGGSPFEVEMAENGEEGFERFVESPDEWDLILMDVEMPVMDGYDATRAIREWEAERDRDPVPIVALTAHALESEREKGREAGMNHHLTKPIKKEPLLETVRSHARTGTAREGGPGEETKG